VSEQNLTPEAGAPAVIVGDLGQLELDDTHQPIYDRGFTLRLLYLDPISGAEHYVIRYPANLKGQRHTHTAAHTIVVLEGQLRANGQVVGPGSYCHFPAGTVMHHEPYGDGECLFVTIFDGPFDVQPLPD
jgi:quercetin dioxygenase-like cupin family protein